MKQSNQLSEKFTDKSILAICLVIALTGVVASKAITLLIIIGGLSSLATLLLTHVPRPRIITAFTVTLAVLFAWASVSSFWSLNESGALKLCIRLIILCIAGILLVHVSTTVSAESRDRLQKALLIGYGIGLLALLIGYAYAKSFNDSLWGGYYFDPLTTLNNGAVMVALLLLPVTMIVWKKHKPVAAIILFSSVTSGLFFLSSGASVFSILTGGLVFILVYMFGRRMGIAIAAVSAFLILTAPYVTNGVTNSDITQTLTAEVPASTKHRLLMWEFVSKKILETPYLGLGMDSSRHIPQDEFRLSSNMEIMPLHPHNAALQLRLELGFPGVIAAVALVLTIFGIALGSQLSREHMALRVGVLCSYLSVGAVSYGVWQSWWIAIAWILAMISTITAPTLFHEVHIRQKTGE